MGIRECEFWNMTMRSFNAHIEGFKLHRKMVDEDNWILGSYVLSAVSTAIQQSFAKHSKAKYVEKPFSVTVEENNKPMSEKELQKQRKLFVAKLEAMKTNFELNHKPKDSKGS